MSLLPKLDYCVTRTYPWRHMSLLVLAVFLVALPVLTVINIPLVGYQLVSFESSVFNDTTHYWWNVFLPHRFRAAQRYCDPYPLRLGESFQTTYGLFTWTVMSLSDDDRFSVPSLPIASYSSTYLSGCDVTSLSISALPRIQSLEATVYITCLAPFFMKASTRYVQDIDVTYDTSRQFWNLRGPSVPQDSAVHRTAYGVMDVVTGFGHDALDELRIQAYPGNISRPWQVAFYTQPTCGNVNESEQNLSPPVYKKGEKQNPELESLHRITDFDQQVVVISPPWDFPANTTVENLFTTLLFATRLDIGRLTANNFFLDVHVINTTIHDIGTSAHAFRAEHTGRHALMKFPIQAYPTTISLSYPCHRYVRKAIGSFLTSLFIAVWTFGNTIFALFSFLAARKARKNSNSNYCAGHADARMRQFQQMEERVSDTEQPLMNDSTDSSFQNDGARICHRIGEEKQQ